MRMRYWNVYFHKRFVATVAADSELCCKVVMLNRGYSAACVSEMAFVDSSACGRTQQMQKA